MKTKLNFMQRAMTSFACIGDIFTDAVEYVASVAAAKNLLVLANLFAVDTDAIASGVLLADGAFVAKAHVRADGTLLFEVPKVFDTEGRDWQFQYVATGELFRAHLYVGDAGDPQTWMISDAVGLYKSIMAGLPDETQAMLGLKATQTAMAHAMQYADRLERMLGTMVAKVDQVGASTSAPDWEEIHILCANAKKLMNGEPVEVQ